MSHHRNPAIAALLVASGLCWTAVGCGGSNPPADSPTPEPSAPPPAATTAEPDTPEPDAPEPDAGECGDKMVKVSAGDLWLGSVKGKGNKDEHPRTQVKLGSFCFDKTEVTVEQFKSCVDNGVCDAPPTSVELENSKSDKADEKRSALCAGNRKGDPTKMPVSCVSHDDAAKFCKWRGGRLPTEIEFEYVATGGEDETTFPWGNSKPDATKVCFGVTEPCPVASKAQEAFGAFDVAGNLQEWTATGYGPYPTPPDTADPVAVRGVSFSAKPADLVSSKTRYSKPAFVRDIDLGFRCAKSL